MPVPRHPIVYVRGYAMTQGDIEQTVDDPFYGFNTGSTHVRQVESGHAAFYVFESPFVRLLTDHQYADVFDGGELHVPAGGAKQNTVWIFRYYDRTSRMFDDRPAPQRLTIEDAAGQLRTFIEDILKQTEAEKVILVAHSMGGLVCRCLIQKIYAEAGIPGDRYVDKFFTYATPHGGITFGSGGGFIERMCDLVGFAQSDTFGPKRMYQYLTPNVQPDSDPPQDFDSRVMSNYPTDRVFCLVGTNSKDYDRDAGVVRTLVGANSDGLVQIKHAYVKASHRAYVHRSHAGRYGIVNSEEGYQNLERFLFGVMKVKTSLCRFTLDFSRTPNGADLTYLFEVAVSIRKLPTMMHERSIQHHCAESLNEERYRDQMTRGGLPLFTTFLLPSRRADQTARYAIRIAVHGQAFKNGVFVFADHLERLPLWSDYLIVELRPRGAPDHVAFDALYSWLSESPEPRTKIAWTPGAGGDVAGDLTLPRNGRRALGEQAVVHVQASDWNA
jgi:hypothetical protein